MDDVGKGRRAIAVGSLAALATLAIIGAGATMAEQITYTYDAAGRLHSTSYDDSSSITYTLDAAGNRNSVATVPPVSPSAPTGLTATVVSGTKINLSWTAPSDTGGPGIAGYTVYRATVAIGTASTTSYSDATVQPQTTYSYTVAAYDSDGNTSGQSTAASATSYPLPSVPTALTGVAISPTEVDLSWTASTDTNGPGLAGYRIYRGGTQIGTSTIASFKDMTAAASTAYSYTVAAYDTATPADVSAQSTAFNITTPAANVPSIPQPVSTTPVGVTYNQAFTVQWGASTGPVAYYTLNESSNWPANYTITAPTTSKSFTNRPNSQTYMYKVQACNSSNQCSAWSNTVQIDTCLSSGCQ